MLMGKISKTEKDLLKAITAAFIPLIPALVNRLLDNKPTPATKEKKGEYIHFEEVKK